MSLLVGWKREREIKKVLRGLARQQVCGFEAARNAGSSSEGFRATITRYSPVGRADGPNR